MMYERIRMSRMLRALLALVVCAGLIGPATVGAQIAKPLRKVSLMLNWYPYGEHAAFYYGVEKGIYRDAGIDLAIQPGGGSTQTVQAVAAGKVDFGYADTPALLKTVAAGAEVKSIGVFLQTTPAAIQFFADKNIKTVADMKGHSVAGSPGDAAYETLAAVLEANHVPNDSVQRLNVDPAGKLTAVISGRADSLAGFYNDQSPTIEARTGKKMEQIRYSEHGVNFFSTGLITSDALLKKDSQLAKDFMRASQRAWQEASSHQSDAVDAESKLAENAPPKDVLAKQFTITLGLLHTPRTTKRAPGVNDTADWESTIATVVKYLGLKNPGKPSAYWDESIARK
jgi:NitT/TauT family transport system substrate-binding protein